MKENYEGIRKTVYISEELVKRAEILYGEAEVNSFSGFVSKAIDAYISKLVADKYGSPGRGVFIKSTIIFGRAVTFPACPTANARSITSTPRLERNARRSWRR